jgi:hypothetical protein
MNISHAYILATFFHASAQERADGASWYDRASVAAAEIAAECSLSISGVAGVVAALSPNNRWERNCADAERLCRLYTAGGAESAAACVVSTYGANKAKALRVLAGEPPLTVLGGLKVRAFYECIIGSTTSVCVDGHAYAIWAGERIATTQTPKISAKLYAAISAAYIQAADTVNAVTGASYSAAQVQAITWLTWRRMIQENGLYRSTNTK